MQPQRSFNLLRILVVISLLILAFPRTSTAAPTESGIYHEDFSSYTNLGYTDQAVWDIFSQNLHLRRSNGVLANYGYDSTAAAWDTNGHLYIAWTDSRSVLNANYLQKLDANGNRLWNADILIGSGDLPSLAAGEDGNVMAVWREGWNIQLMKFSPDGTSAWASPLPQTTDYSNSAPHIVYAGSGNFWISWVSHTDSYDPDRGMPIEFFIEKVDGAGNLLVGPLSLSSGAYGDVFTGALVSDSAGRAWVTWMDRRSAGQNLIYLQGVTVAGSLIFAQELSLGTGAEPSLARSNNGVVVAVNNQLMEKINLSGGVDWSVDPSIYIYGGYLRIHTDASGAIWASCAYNESVRVMKFSSSGVGQLPQAVTLRQSQPGLANGISIDSSGPRPAVIWSDSRSADKQVRLQMISQQGTTAWPVDRQVNDDPGSAVQVYPAVAAAPDGTHYIAWRDNRRGQNNIYLQSLTPSGDRRWAADILVNNPNPGSLITPPGIALDPQGNLFIAWEVLQPFNPNGTVSVQRFDSNGNKAWPQALELHQAWSYENDQPGMAADPAGGFIETWISPTQTLMMQRYDEDGQPRWATPNSGIVPSLMDSPRVHIAIAPDSSTFVVWPGNGDKRVYAQSLSASGQVQWANPVAVSPTAMFWPSYGESAAADSAGNVYIQWSDGHEGRTYAQKLSPAGARLWNSGSQVDIGPVVQMAPVVSVGADDQPIFGAMQFDGFQVWKYSPAGSQLWTNAYSNGYGGYFVQNLSLAGDSNGKVYAAWADLRNGNWDIFLNTLSPTGEFLSPQPVKLVDPDSFYLLSGTAVSNPVDTLDGPIIEANLTADFDPSGGQVAFALSNDGGKTWQDAAPGVNLRFTSHGSDLRWKVELQSDPLWPRGPIVRSVDIAYTSLLPGSDDYEVDDTCAEAQPIETAGVPQRHTFIPVSDEDWVRFDAQAGRVYTVQANNTAENIAVSLELVDSCGGALLAQSTDPMLHNARLDWTAPGNITVYLRASNTAGSSGAAADSSYELSVRGHDPTPLVVLAVGTAETPEAQAALDASGDRAYKAFLATGTSKARLHYFSADPGRDVDGNGLADDITAGLSHDGLRDSIQDWARTSGAGLGVPVYIYLLGPAAPDSLFNLAPGETVSASELNLWLANLEATTGVDRISVIIEAPFSGSFIDAAADNPDTLSSVNRVILTSSSPSQPSYLTSDGAIFSDALTSAMGTELNLRAAFDQAVQAVAGSADQLQQPWIDDNGDTLPDNIAVTASPLAPADAALKPAAILAPGLTAQDRGLQTNLSAAPEIQSATRTVQGPQVQLLVQARDDVSIASLTAEPANCLANITAGHQPILPTTKVALQPVAGQPGWYSVETTRVGVCWFNLLAVDGEGNRSAPYQLSIQGKLYLPALMNKGASH